MNDMLNKIMDILKKPVVMVGIALVIVNKREAQCLDCQETFLLENVVPEIAS